MSKITDIGASLDPQFERVEMSNLNKVSERNRITKQGIDVMITNHLKLECELAEATKSIVQKCASIIKDAVDHREPASTYADKIKQHFGVEE